MNFEELYEKVKNNTATEEEKAYVDKIIKEANESFNTEDRCTINNCTNESTVNKIRSKINLKILKKTVIWTLTSVFTIALVLTILIFTLSYQPAKDNINITQDEARQMAIEYLNGKENIYGENADILKDEKEFELEFPRITQSYFKYEIELMTTTHRIEITINSRTGAISTQLKDLGHH